MLTMGKAASATPVDKFAVAYAGLAFNSGAMNSAVMNSLKFNNAALNRQASVAEPSKLKVFSTSYRFLAFQVPPY